MENSISPVRLAALSCPWYLRLRQLRREYPSHEQLNGNALRLALNSTVPVHGEHARTLVHYYEQQLALPLS